MSDNPKKSLKQVLINSLIIIPIVILFWGGFLFGMMHLLTRESRTAYDYLEDVKTGGLNKRWQGAFELSKILADPDFIPKEPHFVQEIIKVFEKSEHDDNRVRQYLALAMGRTQRQEFIQPLIDGLKNEKEENLASLIYAIGMLKQKTAASALHSYATHPQPRIRSITMTALGNMANSISISVLQKGLNDSEPNVRWGAALSLAQMNDFSGNFVLSQMLERTYFDQFPQVDTQESSDLIIAVIKVAEKIESDDFIDKIKYLAKNDQDMKVRAAAMRYSNR